MDVEISEKSKNFNRDVEDSENGKLKIKKIKDLQGKKFERKEEGFAKFIADTSASKRNNSPHPSFPTYEVIDDEDLL